MKLLLLVSFKNSSSRILLTALLMLMAISLVGQVPISGQVVDKDSGEPLPGANVVVKGSMIGTQTDVNGNFNIDIEIGQILVISYIGFEDVELQVNNTSFLQVADVSCQDTDGTITLEAGTYYVVIRSGGITFGADGIVIDNVTMMSF